VYNEYAGSLLPTKLGNVVDLWSCFGVGHTVQNPYFFSASKFKK